MTDRKAEQFTQIGRFTIVREIGRGLASVTYLAHDRLMDRQVALKTVPMGMSSTQKKNSERLLVNEARAAGRMSYPGVIAIYEAIVTGEPYLVMEYPNAPTLARLISYGHGFSLSDLGRILFHLAEALDHIHQAGVVHRDIKPANIYLRNKKSPVIAEFSIARAPNRVRDEAAPPDVDPFTLFHPGELLGTPNYMSPEQALSQHADARSDIYSLGVIGYELLTGRKPFVGADTDELLYQIGHATPPAPHSIAPEVPASVSHIIMRAMAKDPDQRYQAAGDLADDLKRCFGRAKRRRNSDAQAVDEGGPAVAPAPQGIFARAKELLSLRFAQTH